MRRTLLALTLVSAFAVPARAEFPSSTPLRTICSDPTMSLCVNFWTWTVEPHYVNGEFISFGHWITEVATFGSGWVDNGSVFAMTVTEYAEGCTAGFYDNARTQGPGFYVLAEGNPMCYLDNGVESSVYDLWAVRLDNVVCNLLPDSDQPCYEVDVPEPASALLLATGLFGLAIVRRRRVSSLEP